MKRTFTLTVLAVLAAVAAITLPGVTWTAVGQDRSQPQGDTGHEADQPSHSGMMQGGMMQGGMKHGMMGGMDTKKMSEPMKTRYRMMMNMEVTSQDPAALLAIKDQLKLTEEQSNRLQAILAQARQQTQEVLTDKQKTSLRLLEKTPKTMMEMQHQMMGKMGPSKGGMKMQ